MKGCFFGFRASGAKTGFGIESVQVSVPGLRPELPLTRGDFQGRLPGPLLFPNFLLTFGKRGDAVSARVAEANGCA